MTGLTTEQEVIEALEQAAQDDKMIEVDMLYVDETEYWNTKTLKEHKIKSVHGAYLVEKCDGDFVRTYCCSMSPSVWCEEVGSMIIMEKDATDEQREEAEDMANEARCLSSEYGHYSCYYEVKDTEIDEGGLLSDTPPHIFRVSLGEFDDMDDAMEYARGNGYA